MVSEEVRLLEYPVRIDRGGLADLANFAARVAPAHRYAIITDSNVGPIYSSRVAARFPSGTVETLTFPAGEANKSRDSWAQLTDELLQRGLGRDTTVIALGGGVTGDLAGFVAATFMRGVQYVQVPTSLLAMVDSSIGGKTGVDTPAGKNLVGSFHPPKAVLIDPQTLLTLPLSEFRTGLAEALKHGVIADSDYFDFLTRSIPELLADGSADGDAMIRIIVRSVEIKAGIVRKDARESGVRQVLNFGHTVGHAIEAVCDYRMSHGDAVAIGMVAEARIAERVGIGESGLADRLRESLRSAGLPVELPSQFSGKEGKLLKSMFSDKKRRAGELRFALPIRIGAMAGSDTGWTVPVAEPLIREVLA